MSDRWKSMSGRLLAPAALALALTACDGSPQPGDPPAAPPGQEQGGQADGGEPAADRDVPNPCTLLTADQAAELLGGPAEVSEPLGAGVGSQCSFDRSGTRGITVGVTYRHTSLDDLKELVEGGEKLGMPYESVDGIGDAAYYTEGIGTLYFLADDRVYYTLALGDASRERTTAAARYVAGNVS